MIEVPFMKIPVVGSTFVKSNKGPSFWYWAARMTILFASNIFPRINKQQGVGGLGFLTNQDQLVFWGNYITFLVHSDDLSDFWTINSRVKQQSGSGMVATADADEDGAAKASWIGYMESIVMLGGEIRWHMATSDVTFDTTSDDIRL